MLTISLQNFEGVREGIKGIAKQANFAASKALNKIAVEVQTMELTKELPSHLKLRGQWFKPRTKYGINVSKFAKKDSLVAIVGTQANWLVLVDSGGTKKSSTGKALAVPTDALDRSTPRNRKDKPARLLATGKAFLVGKPGHRGIYIRTGSGKTDIKRVYSFKPRARIPHLIHFEEPGINLANARWVTVFSEEFKRALETAK